MLEKGIPAHKDRALLNMISLFPNVMNSISDLTKEIDIVGNSLNNEEADINELNKKEVISDLINNSKLGNYTYVIIYFIVVCVLSIAGFCIYTLIFKYKVLDNIADSANFLYQADSMLHHYSNYLFLKVMNYAYNKAPNSIFSNSDTQMNKISPFWYKSGHAKKIEINDETVANNIGIILLYVAVNGLGS